jgi:DNA-binding beta-propeller fold protein YncE
MCRRIPALSLVLTIPVAAPAVQGAEVLDVAESLGDDVTIIRLPDCKVVGSIQAGVGPHGLVASRSGDHLYISVESDHSVLALDAASGEILVDRPRSWGAGSA